MKILIACEFSGTVRDAFIKKGHDAWSCDILPTESKGPHFECNVLDVLDKGWDMMIAHPPCFTKDTLILTKNGYKEIGNIVIGEEVLTHKGRWRQVTEVSKRYVDKTIKVNITGSNVIHTTHEHPFLVKERKWIWNNDIRRYEKTISNERWIQSKDINSIHLVGSVLPPEEDSNQNIDDEHLWLMGVYLADGHLRFRNNKFEEVCFSIGVDKIDYFTNNIKRKNKVYKEKSVCKIKMYNKDFCQSFAQFGRSCEAKEVPGWILKLPPKRAKIFLEGYLFGDGHLIKDKSIITSSSVSKKLSVGISLLMRKVYNKPSSLNFNKRKPKTIIEGRLVNQQCSWTAKCSFNSTKTKSIIDNNYTWYQYIGSEESGPELVFNISVEEDESYIVNQAIVHNCTFITNAGVRHLYGHIQSKNGKKAKINGEERWQKMYEACDFFNALKNAPIDKICIENPVPHKYARERIGQYQQIIHPWMFSDHTTSKATCLWLKNLPLLVPDKFLPKEQRTYEIHKASPGPNRWKVRSKTFLGVAEAMAEQWTKQ